MVFLITFNVGSKKNLSKWVGVGAFDWSQENRMSHISDRTGQFQKA